MPTNTEIKELRDRLAKATGWHAPDEPQPDAPSGYGEWWHEHHPSQQHHPIPRSVDKLLELWKERAKDWWWQRGGSWSAGLLRQERERVPDTGNIFYDLGSLLEKVLKRNKETER